MRKIRVLIVDDSPLMRKLLIRIIEEEDEFEVAGTAPNGMIALDRIAELNPDVVTLDIEMPGMNGIETLKRIMSQSPMPVIMISAYTDEGAEQTFKALDLGAVDFITKPSGPLARSIVDMKNEIIVKIKTASKLQRKKIEKEKIAEIEKDFNTVRKPKRIKKQAKFKKCKNIISIGVSTGGPEALTRIMPLIPADINAGILIVQHMPIGFTGAFARRLDSISQINIKEAEPGDIVLPGKALVARGDHHLTVINKQLAIIAQLNHRQRVSFFRPSIDVLMKSSSDIFGERNIGILMTGMGHDGVAGMKMIKERGGKTIAQDEDTSVVFGMNRLAIRSGCVDKTVPLEKIMPTAMNYLE